MTVLGMALISGGVFFLVTGAVGMVRFPDIYTRMHAAGKCDTLGSLLVMTGLACHDGFVLTSAKLLIAAGFILVTSPTATHAIARAARQSGVEAWTAEGNR